MDIKLLGIICLSAASIIIAIVAVKLKKTCKDLEKAMLELARRVV
jgi:hypothetical protein